MTSKSTKSEQQPSLPFAIEGNTANRLTVREVSTAVDYMRKIDLSMVRIRPDRFNARIKPEGMSEAAWDLVLLIPTLADGIHANGGPADPILGDFHKDGYFYLTNGERRYRAMVHLTKTKRDKYPNGELVTNVYVLINPPGTTDLERRKKMYITNDNLPFTPMQKAHYFASFKVEPYSLTHDQIALEFKVSRQTIDNYVLATTLPKDVQEKIDNGEIKISNALDEYRKEKAANKKGVDDIELLSPSQEYHRKEDELKKDKVRGDEEEFEQEDNTVTSAGSRGGPKETGSNAIVVGKDSIYMMEQKLALWKQAINRLDVIRQDVASNLPYVDTMGEVYTADGLAIWIQKEVATRMMNEYNLTVK